MSKQEQGIKLFGKTITLKPTTEQKDHRDQNKESHDPTVEKRPDKIIPCPRCMSMETKFCYYNNYNVNQPRHFCKGCQRYWTAGGALRNVPVGAGRRKSKPVGRVGGFVEEFIYEGGSGGVVDEYFELNGVVLEELHVAAHGGFPHVFPLKRRRCVSSGGQPC